MLNFITDLFDPHAQLKQQATDRNWYLWHAGDHWEILDSEGKILSIALLPAEAYLKAIYQPNTHVAKI